MKWDMWLKLVLYTSETFCVPVILYTHTFDTKPDLYAWYKVDGNSLFVSYAILQFVCDKLTFKNSLLAYSLFHESGTQTSILTCVCLTFSACRHQMLHTLARLMYANMLIEIELIFAIKQITCCRCVKHLLIVCQHSSMLSLLWMWILCGNFPQLGGWESMNTQIDVCVSERRQKKRILEIASVRHFNNTCAAHLFSWKWITIYAIQQSIVLHYVTYNDVRRYNTAMF